MSTSDNIQHTPVEYNLKQESTCCDQLWSTEKMLCYGGSGHRQGRGKYQQYPRMTSQWSYSLIILSSRTLMTLSCKVTLPIMSTPCICSGNKSHPASTYLGRSTLRTWKAEICLPRKHSKPLQPSCLHLQAAYFKPLHQAWIRGRIPVIT